MQTIKTKDVVAYAIMPRILPRAKVLFFSGFGYIAYLMANIFQMARLIPKGHPYLNPANIGRFGIRHVTIEAARALKFTRNNIDQVFIFFAIMAALAILMIQIIFLAVSFVAAPVFASMFVVADPSNDLSYQILNLVFGIPNLFCTGALCPPSNTAVVGTATDSVFHNALHNLFQFYSTALLMIAILIFIYFVIVVVLETAVSGTPFGQRFQNVWVPVRLVVAIGLLLPLNFGLNSAQYITLYAAKYGSAWATNSWALFNTGITGHPLFGGTGARLTGERFTMLAIPQQVELGNLIASMALVHACAYRYLLESSTDVVGAQGAGGAAPHWRYSVYNSNTRDYPIKPYLVKNPESWMVAGANIAGYTTTAPLHTQDRLLITSSASLSFRDAAAFYFGGDIIIRFGEYAVFDPMAATPTPLYSQYEGGVKPTCGDIRIPVTSLRGLATDPGVTGGALYMLRYYYNLVLEMWFDDYRFAQFARSFVTYHGGGGTVIADEYRTRMCGAVNAPISGCNTVAAQNGFPACDPVADCANIAPSIEFMSDRVSTYRPFADQAIRNAWALYLVNSTDPDMENNLLERGWAGAGAWFNRIAEINGMFIDGVRAVPEMIEFPLVMEEVSKAKAKTDLNVPIMERFTPTLAAPGGTYSAISIPSGAQGLEIARVLNIAYQFFGGDAQATLFDDAKSSSNPFFDVMNFFFGSAGIVNMRSDNRHMHPLAQLVAVGKGLVDSAVNSIAMSTGLAIVGGFTSAAYSKSVGGMAEAVSRMILSTAFLGLMAGFVLFYVLPFLPFVYFFFAVGTWVKTIFEAMVGTPLWALAHLRIDGEGLPGDAASNGYFLLLEIFIRPMLSVFGLVAAITIFAAQVHVLNIIWELVIANATGFAGQGILTGALPATSLANEYQRPVLDQFFFMIIFTIICYMLALASFKLIDQIPNNILRWAGIGVSAFGDMNAEQADALGGYVQRGSTNMGQDLADAVRSGGAGLGSGLGQAVKGVSKSGPAE